MKVLRGFAVRMPATPRRKKIAVPLWIVFSVVACRERPSYVESVTDGGPDDAQTTPDGRSLDTLPTWDGGAMEVNTESLLSPPLDGNQRYPVAVHAGGVHFVVWQEGREVWGGNSRIRGKLVGQDGTSSAAFTIANMERIQEAPAVTTDGNVFFTVWQDFRNGEDYDLYGARVTKTGGVLDPDGVLISGGAGNQSRPSAAFDGEHFVVAWMDNRVATPSYHIRAARVTRDGRALDPSGIHVAGVVDRNRLNDRLGDDFTMVPTFAWPSVACHQRRCMIAHMAKDSAGTTWSMAPEVVRLDVGNGISLVDEPMRMPPHTVYRTSDNEASPSCSHGKVSLAVNSAGKYLFVSTGLVEKGGGHYFVAAIRLAFERDAPIETLSIRKAAMGLHTGKIVVAPYAGRFMVLWADVNKKMENPTLYSLKGALVEGDPATSPFTPRDFDTVYRGFPHISIGATHSLVVYEKDAGPTGLQIAGVLYPTEDPPWHASASSN